MATAESFEELNGVIEDGGGEQTEICDGACVCDVSVCGSATYPTWRWRRLAPAMQPAAMCCGSLRHWSLMLRTRGARRTERRRVREDE